MPKKLSVKPDIEINRIAIVQLFSTRSSPSFHVVSPEDTYYSRSVNLDKEEDPVGDFYFY